MLVIGVGCFIHFVLIPDYKQARAQDYELFYGEKTYEVWRKVNPDKELTYEEWKYARYSRVIKYKEY